MADSRRTTKAFTKITIDPNVKDFKIPDPGKPVFGPTGLHLLHRQECSNCEHLKAALRDNPTQADFDALVFERNILQGQLSSEIEKRIALEAENKAEREGG